jgi:enoyl-CoA hydratase
VTDATEATYETLRVERRDDGVAVVTIDREAKRNAMSVTFFRELPRLMDDLSADERVRAAVITGAGDEAFSAGGDLTGFAELDGTTAHRRQLRLVYDAFHAVERADVAVVAAVNGIAYGGGTELVLACDVAIASDRARFAFREPTVGLMPGYGVVRGPDVIGHAWTRYLALTAEVVDADEAQRIGLVVRTVPHERLLDEALRVAGLIAAQAPLAVQVAKSFVNRDLQAPGLAASIEATALLFATDDHREGLAAFAERRPPRFQGR